MTPPPRLDLSMADLEALLERAKTGPLSPADYETLKAALATLGYLTELLEDRTTTLQRLRHLLFGARTETTQTVCPPAPEVAGGAASASGGGFAASPSGAPGPAAPRPRARGQSSLGLVPGTACTSSGCSMGFALPAVSVTL